LDSVASLKADAAQVTDCLSIRLVTYDATSGKRKLASPPGPFPLSVTLARAGTAWKVALIAPGKSSCAARRPTAAATPSHSQ
jgi:hypothetical protein